MNSLFTPVVEQARSNQAQSTDQVDQNMRNEAAKAQAHETAPLRAPQAPTDAQMHVTPGSKHNVADYMNELHGVHTEWEGHALDSNSPIWHGTALEASHGTTLGILIKSMGSDFNQALNGEVWKMVSLIMAGDERTAQNLVAENPKLEQVLQRFIEQVSNDQTQARELAALTSPTPQPATQNYGARATHIHSLNDILFNHVGGHDDRIVDQRPLSQLSQPLLQTGTASNAANTSNPANNASEALSVGAQLRILGRLLSVPEKPDSAAKITEQGAQVVLKDPKKLRHSGTKIKNPNKTPKKIHRRGEAHMSTRHDDEETTAARLVLPRRRRPAAMMAALSTHGT